MYRKYILDLEEWLNDPLRKPLIVWGARQVGKTYLIRDIFAATHFPEKHIYVDCIKNKRIADYIARHMDVSEILNFLSIEFNMDIDEKTLLIFDEVQECLPIITMLKYFCQERRELPVIVTGSMVRIKMLLENKEDNDAPLLFPVGKINQLTMYPLNFGEYLLNRNSSFHALLVDAFNKKTPLETELHQKALDYFYDYLLLGGMPEVVDTYLKLNNYKKAMDTLKDLYDNYLADMSLYQKSSVSLLRTRAVFNNIYSQLNKRTRILNALTSKKD